MILPVSALAHTRILLDGKTFKAVNKLSFTRAEEKDLLKTPFARRSKKQKVSLRRSIKVKVGEIAKEQSPSSVDAENPRQSSRLGFGFQPHLFKDTVVWENITPNSETEIHKYNLKNNSDEIIAIVPNILFVGQVKSNNEVVSWEQLENQDDVDTIDFSGALIKDLANNRTIKEFAASSNPIVSETGIAAYSNFPATAQISYLNIDANNPNLLDSGFISQLGIAFDIDRNTIAFIGIDPLESTEAIFTFDTQNNTLTRVVNIDTFVGDPNTVPRALGDKDYIAIHGNHIVWQELFQDQELIYVYNTVNNSKTKVFEIARDNSRVFFDTINGLSLFGNRISWTTRNRVFVYDIEQGQTRSFKAANNLEILDGPSLYENNLVYGAGAEVFLQVLE